MNTESPCDRPALPALTPARARLAAWSVFAVAALVCLLKLGSLTLYETDEGFAATRADSFFRHHSWILSYDDVGEDQPQFRKPPLLYWCVAALLKLLGHNTWAVRLPTAAAGFLAMVLLYRLVRRYADEWTALTATLLMCTVPFLVFHVRTAMLELPVVCAVLAGMYGFAFLPDAWWRPVLVGLCGGAAILTKGSGGIQAVIVPVLFGLTHHRLRRRVWAESVVVVAVALACPALYYFAVPAEYRERVIRDLFIGEGAKRVKAAGNAWERLGVGMKVLVCTLRWHVPAAACGMALVAVRALRRRSLFEWLAITLAFIVPLLWVYAAMVPPFPRYLLPVFPFILSFSALFAMGVTAGSPGACLLVPFAWWATQIDHRDPWQWVPVAASLVTLLCVWSGWTAERPRRRLLASALLAAAIATASRQSPAAWALNEPPIYGPKPELLPLVAKAAQLVPETERLIVESRVKCHTILFYGRRAIDGSEQWLLSKVVPGETRYSIFFGEHPLRLPFIHRELVDRAGRWQLFRLTVESGERPWRGMLLAKANEREKLARTMDLLNVETEPFENGFILRRVPEYAETPAGLEAEGQCVVSGVSNAWAAGQAVTLQKADALTLPFKAPMPCCGVDIVPENRRAEAAGWIIQGREAASGSWRDLKRVDGSIEPYYTISNGRVQRSSRLAVRARFAPVEVTALRIERTAAPVEVADVTVWLAGLSNKQP